MDRLKSWQVIFEIVMIISVCLLVGLYVISQIFFVETAEDKCKELGLEVFDYSGGNIFTQSSITCINKSTKEITKIR